MALTDNLRAYWNLDESSGNAADSSGNGYTLTNTNTVGYAAALINNGADFGTSNTNKRLVTTNDLGIDGGNISISGWIKLRTEISDGGFWSFLEQRGAATDVNYRIDYMRSGSTYTLGANRARNGVSDHYVTTTGALGTSNWHHVVLTYDGTLRFYVNGSSVGTPLVTSGNGSGAVNDGFAIAATANGFLHASIYADEVGVWSRALTADEVTELYNGGIGLTYPFEGGGGAVFTPKVSFFM